MRRENSFGNDAAAAKRQLHLSWRGEMGSIEQFLEAEHFAVAGASRDRQKYGNKVLRALQAHRRDVVAINPKESEVESAVAYPSLDVVPQKVDSLSIVTPPAVTRKVVGDAIAAGVKNIWMQPGAEDPEAVEAAVAAGVNVIADGSCILVELARRESET